MTRIEDYIRKHRDEFDSETPSVNHFAAFEQKLAKTRGLATSKHTNRHRIIQVAATAILVLSSALLIDKLSTKDNESYSKEIKVIKNSYNEMLNAKYRQINIAVDNLPESVREDYEKEVENIKKETRIMEKVSEMSGNTPETREALMMHYKKADKILTKMVIKAEKTEHKTEQNNK